VLLKYASVKTQINLPILLLWKKNVSTINEDWVLLELRKHVFAVFGKRTMKLQLSGAAVVSWVLMDRRDELAPAPWPISYSYSLRRHLLSVLNLYRYLATNIGKQVNNCQCLYLLFIFIYKNSSKLYLNRYSTKCKFDIGSRHGLIE